MLEMIFDPSITKSNNMVGATDALHVSRARWNLWQSTRNRTVEGAKRVGEGWRGFARLLDPTARSRGEIFYSSHAARHGTRKVWDDRERKEEEGGSLAANQHPGLSLSSSS
jgi:hypothetical protein